MKLLIVDDEPAIRRSLKRVAGQRSHEVFEAEDGLKGLQMWRQALPDLVFLDVLMPGLSGPEVLKEIKGHHRSKVVLISAYSGEYNHNTVQSLGADLFIAKPFSDIFAVMDQAEALLS